MCAHVHVCIRDVKTLFGKPAFGCLKPVLNRFSVFTNLHKSMLLYNANNFMYITLYRTYTQSSVNTYAHFQDLA